LAFHIFAKLEADTLFSLFGIKAQETSTDRHRRTVLQTQNTMASLSDIRDEQLYATNDERSDEHMQSARKEAFPETMAWLRKAAAALSEAKRDAKQEFLSERQRKSLDDAWKAGRNWTASVVDSSPMLTQLAEAWSRPSSVLADAPLALELVTGRECDDAAVSACLGVYLLEKRLSEKRPVWRHAHNPDRWLAFHRGAWCVLPLDVLEMPPRAAVSKVMLGRADDVDHDGCTLRRRDVSLRLPTDRSSIDWEVVASERWDGHESRGHEWLPCPSIECRALPASAARDLRKPRCFEPERVLANATTAEAAFEGQPPYNEATAATRSALPSAASPSLHRPPDTVEIL
jgi:hypothetical protein